LPEEFGPHKEIITSIYQLSPEALEQVAQWVEQRGIRTPISQVVGFSKFTAQIATVATSETRNNTAYGDLATAGPTLTLLPSGHYIFWYGAQALHSQDAGGSGTAYMSPSINGATPSDDVAAKSLGSPNTLSPYSSVMSATIADLTLDNNTVKCQYRTGAVLANAGTWNSRFLIALRTGNIS